MNSGNFPKAMQGGRMKGASKAAIKKDKALDKQMTPKQLKSDIKADRKLLATKVGKKK